MKKRVLDYMHLIHVPIYCQSFFIHFNITLLSQFSERNHFVRQTAFNSQSDWPKGFPGPIVSTSYVHK